MLNRCEFIGNLGADPEIRSTQGGEKVANFRIACTERWKDQSGNQKERTEWVPIVVWGGLVRVCESYLRKGSKVYVAGKFSVRKWQDQSGADRYSTEVVLQGFGGTLVMLDTRGGGEGGGYGGGGQGGYGSGQDHPPARDIDDEIPF